MKAKFRRAIALIMTVALVATTITFTAGNTLKATDEPGETVATEQKAETAPAPEQTEPVKETQSVVVESDSAADSDSGKESAESETAEDGNEPSSDEEKDDIKMPAQQFSDRAGNGITVSVSAPEGAFPEGTTMKVTAVNHAKAVSMVEDRIDEVQDANGVDITFYKDGKEIQPEKNISVKLGNAGVDGDNFSVYHVSDNQSVDKVTDNASADGASFKAGEFSIYIVVGQEETQDIPDSLKVKFRFLSSSYGELAAPDTIYVEKNEQGKYVIEYTIPELEGKTAESVDCDGADFAISEDGKTVTATVDAGEDDSVQQEASCDIIYVSQKAEYTVKHVFEKEGAAADTPENEKYEAKADVPDNILIGEIGTETKAVPQVVNGFTAQDIDQEIISGDSEQPTVVTIKYDRNKYFLTYDTQGGSYVKGKTISYGSSVDVYSKNDSKLTCTKEEHTHTAVPSQSASNNKRQTIGCYTSTRNGSWSYEWVLSCNKNEHTHDSSCYGSAISDPVPTRQGYTFEGWYSDPECKIEAPQTIDSVEGDYTVYAKWAAKEVNYTVVVRKENVDGSYSFVTSSTDTAKTGDTVTASEATFENSGYYHLRDTTSAVVKADGSTVVYADYELNTYTLKFDLDKSGAKITMNGESYTGSEYTISCKLGEDISAKWPTAANISGTSSTFYGWKPSNSNTVFVSKRFEVTEDMIGSKTNGSTTTYTARWENGTKIILHYMLQNADDDGYTDSKKFYQEAYTSSGSFNAKSIYGYSNVDSKNTTKTINGVKNYYFYYNRNTSSITYYFNDTVIDTKNGIRFDKNINTSEYNFTPERPGGMDSDYTFGGWYDNPGCTGDSYVFNTMPATNLALYAKWIAPEKTITVHFENGSDKEEITVTKGEYVEIQTPSKPGYNFVGWYTKDGEAFDINAPVNENAEIYAHWTKKTKVAYRVEFVTAGGDEVAEGYTSVGRPGAKVVADAVTATGKYQGWFPDSVQKTITLNDDPAKNVITFKYSDKNDFKYQVVYKCGDEVVSEGEEITVHENTVRVAAGNIPAGYILAGEQFKTVSLGNDGVTRIVFQLSPKTYTISYNNTKSADWSGEAGCKHPDSYTIKDLGSIKIDGLKNSGDSVFLGWDFTSKNADGSDASIYGGHNAVNPVIESGTYGNLEFTAKWGKITAQDVVVTYDGQAHGITEPSVELPSGCSVKKFMYSNTQDGKYSETIPEWTNAGEYTVYVKCVVEGYRNLKTTATVKIVKRNVTLTSANASKTYDGKPLTNNTVEVTGDGFVSGEGATYNVTGSQTAAGSSKNTFKYTLNNNTNADNYEITTKEGTLTVAKKGSVVVTITGNNYEADYNGQEQSVNGYTIQSSDPLYTADDFTGPATNSEKATAKGTDAGTYTMSMADSDFANANDNFENVTFVVVPGALTIKKIATPITITAASKNKTYDGTALTDSSYTYTQDVLLQGDVLTAVVEGTITNYGTAENKVTSYSVMHGDRDVTENYTFATPASGVLSIDKRPVELTSASASKVYDGTPLTKNEVTVSSGSFVSGEGFTANATGSQTVKGSSDNTFTYELNEGTLEGNYNVSKVYGTLTVTPITKVITIEAASGSKTYDGTPLTDNGFTYTEEVLSNGDRIEATVNGTITNAGTAANSVISYRVMRGDTDVTECYTFGESKSGTLTVNKRSVTLTSATDSKMFDGTALTNSKVIVTGDGFAAGEGATYSVTGSQTRAGSSANKFTYTLNEGTDSNNYDITKVEGTLTVSKKGLITVTITEHSDTKTYNGVEQKVTGYDISIPENSLYTEADFTGPAQDSAEATAKGTDAGTYNMNLKSSDFTNINNDFNVEFRIVDGTLTIDKVNTAIVITAASDSKKYDGTPLTNGAYTYTENVIAGNDELKVTVDGSALNVGDPGDNKVVSYKVMNGTKDVTDNYTFGTPVDGKLTIIPRTVNITSCDAEKTYDGTALTKHEVNVTGDGFADGEGASYSYTGSQLVKGRSDNTFTYNLNDNTDADNYIISTDTGTLTVKQITTEIIITAASGSKTYDGKPLENAGYTYTEDVLVSGDVLTATVSGTITDAGSADNVIQSYRVMNGTTDVTECYTFGNSVNGTLKVSKRAITLTSGTAEKTYDGNPLTCDTVTESGDGFVEEENPIIRFFAEGEGYSVDVTGTRTIAGTSKNTFTYTLNDKTKASNYEITKIEGDLTVNPIETPIVITAKSDSKKYDGTALINDGYTFTEGILVEGDKLTAEVSGSRTNAGASDNVVDSYAVMKGNLDVTSCYTFGESQKGTLIVTKRSVTLTSASDHKVYDGEALTNDNVTVGGDGFADGEGCTTNVTGSQTEVGGNTGNNEFTYTLNEGTDEQNYDIQTVNGTLTVTPAGGVVVTLRENSGAAVYDGTRKTVTGYEIKSVTINDKETRKYGSDDFRFIGDESHKTVSGIDVGTYDMGLLPEDFENTNRNYENVTFVIEDGQLNITKNDRILVVKAEDASKEYDGSALSMDSYTCENEGIIADGDKLVVEIEGSITDAGTAVNTVKSVKVMRGNADVSGNYNIGDAQNGTLTVTKRHIEVTSATDKKKYDGTALTNKTVTVTEGSFADGEGATFNVTGTITDWGTVPNSFTTVFNSNTNSGNYDIKEVTGTLTIEKADKVRITIKGNHDSFTYDGREHKVSGYAWTASESMVKMSDFTFNGTADASRTDAGTTQMGLTPEMFSCNSGNYEGMTFVIVEDGYVKILPIDTKITVTALGASKMYDGSALTAGYKYTQNVLISGDVLTATVSGSQTDVGKSNNIVTDYKVMRGDTDVTGNYTFAASVPGELEVTKRTVILTSATDSKTYDGKVLENKEIKVSGDGFVKGEGFTKNVTGAITDPGEVDNTFTYKLKDGTKAGNYDISTVTGKLTVKPVTAELLITAGSASKEYDGTALNCSSFTVTDGVLAEGDRAIVEISGSQKDAGTSSNTVSGYSIKRGDKDVTSNYSNIKTADGTLQVTPKAVTMTSGTNSWTYDNEPHSEPVVNAVGFVDGEGATYSNFASITEAGTVNNTFDYELNSNTKKENYIINKQLGLLTVSQDEQHIIVTITGATDEKTYDGKKHTVNGYTVSVSNPKYKESFIKFTGKASASGTDAGTYMMGLKSADFRNINTNFTDVEFIVNDGVLVINPISSEIVITAASATKVYDGTPLTNGSFTYTEDVLVKGDTLTAAVDGSQTNAGVGINAVKSWKVTRNGTDVTGNYSFGQPVSGTLEVTKRTVILKSEDARKTYDSTALTCETVAEEGEGFASGEGASYSNFASITEQGETANSFEYALKAGTSGDNYTITKSEGKLKIDPVTDKITVKITGNSDSKVYNGQAQSVAGYSVETDNDLYDKDCFSYLGGDHNTASGIDAGTYKMAMTAGDFANTSSNFTNVEFVIDNGTLEITPIKTKIEIKANSDSKMYDGQPLTNGGYTFTENVLLDGDVLTAETSGSITNAGTAANTVSSYRVMRADKDVTGNYSGITTADGTLNVTKRPITIQSQSAAKVYDKSPLTETTVNVTGENGFANGEGFAYSNFASITEVSKIDNTYSYAALPGTNLDNYTVTQKFGTLEVTKRGTVVVTIKGNTGSYEYDGTAKTVTGYTWSASCNTDDKKLYTEDDFTFSSTASIEEVESGTYYMGLDATDFENNNNNMDVVFVVNDGMLVINPVEQEVIVEVTENSGSFAYDGTEKKVEGYEWKANNSLYKKGDFNFTGEDVVSGVKAGSYDMNLNASDFSNVSKNFAQVTFRIIDGKLTITPADISIRVKAKDAVKVYDGTALTESKWKYMDGSGVPVDGDEIEVINTGSQTDAGRTDNIPTVKIIHNGEDVTSSYKSVSGENGTLEVTRREISFTSADDKKVYDGKPLTNSNVTIAGTFPEGQGAAFDVTGSIIDPGEADNEFTYTLTGGAKESNYRITKLEGKLKVTKVTTPITITAGSAEKTYDGTPLISDKYTYTPSVLANGDVLTAKITGARTDAGNSDNVVQSYGVMRGTKDVTENYTFAEPVDGILTVNKKAVTLQSGTKSWTYDGEIHSEPVVYAEGFVEGEGVAYSNFATITDAGSKYNTFDYKLNSNTKADNYVIEKKLGLLTVAKRGEIVVTIEENSRTADYNGMEQIVQGYSVTTSNPLYTAADFSKPAMDSEKATARGTEAREAIYPMNLKADDFENINENFDNVRFVIVDGGLKINKKEITISARADSDEKMYDGKALKAGGTIQSGSDLPAGQTYSVITEGSITDAGTTENRVTNVLIMDGEEDVTANYKIFAEFNPGTLTVNKREITLKSSDGQKMYDGTALRAEKITVDGDGFADGEGADYNVTGSQKNAGFTNNAFTYTLKDNTKPGNYNISKEEGVLTVLKRTVNLTSNSGSKQYDGKPLTDEHVTVSGDGFVEGEAANIRATGSVTTVKEGYVTNTITFDRIGDFNESNYIINYNEGQLFIAPKDDIIYIQAPSGSKMYDGTALSSKDFENGGYSFTEGILEDGDVLTAEITGRIKNVGFVQTNVDSWSVMRGEKDVTSSYRFETIPGEFSITPREITVTSDSASKQFDGKLLTANRVTISGDMMATDESLIILFGDGLRNVGSKKNDFRILGISRVDADEPALALSADDVSQSGLENYLITSIFGTLTITAAENADGGNTTGGTTFNGTGLVVTDGYGVTVIGDADTPLANSLLDATCCILHLLIMLAAMLMLIWYTYDMKKRQKRIFELKKELQKME